MTQKPITPLLFAFAVFMVPPRLTAQDLTINADSPLSLAEAVELALKQNDQLAISQEESQKSLQDQRIARSALLPQINANASLVRIDRDRAESSYGSVPLESATAGFSASQIVFNDPAITNYRVSSRLTEIAALETDVARLDVVYAAASAFVQWNSRQAMLEIERNNLELTRRNLELAQTRREAGVAGPEEVYRWKTEIAARQSAVNSAKTNLNNARTQLNRVVKMPLRTNWRIQPLRLNDDEYEFLGARIFDVLDQKPGYDVFIERCQETLTNHSPELKTVRIAIDAQQLSVAQLQRRFFVPDVALQFTYDYTLAENLEGDDVEFGGGTDFNLNAGDDEDWSLVLRADFPLFEGGGRGAELARAKAELRRLLRVQSQTVDSLEQALLNAIYALGSSHPNIQLTRDAADTADKNLEVVRDKYANGKASILDLVDAQNQAFVQRQASVIAVYEFMQNMIDVQRAMAWFEFTAEKQTVNQWLDELETRMQRDGSL